MFAWTVNSTHVRLAPIHTKCREPDHQTSSHPWRVQVHAREEIYISDICGDLENRDDSGRLISINPQRAWFDEGKFRFQFPSLWYQSNCNNKAIGLRGIKLQPECVAFLIKVHIMKRDSRTGEFSEFDTLDIYQQFLPETSIQEILSDIAVYFLNWAAEYHPNEKFNLEWSYNAKRSQAKLSIWSRDQRYNPDTWQMFIDIDHEFESECGFLECFNTTDDYLRQIKKEFVFDNVWNRRSLFVHASFVTGTSATVPTSTSNSPTTAFTLNVTDSPAS